MGAWQLAHDGSLVQAIEEARVAWSTSDQPLIALTACPISIQADEQAFALEVCEVMATSLGLWEGTEPGVLAHLWVAQIRERMGKQEEARERYRRLLDLCGESDEDLIFHRFDGTRFDPVAEARAGLHNLAATRAGGI